MEKQFVKIVTILSLFLAKPPLVDGDTISSTKATEQCKAIIERQLHPVGLDRILWVFGDSYAERTDFKKCVREKMSHFSYSNFDRRYYATTRSDSAYRLEAHVNKLDAQQTTDMANIVQYNRVASSTQEIDSKQTLENLPSVRGYETIKGAQNR